MVAVALPLATAALVGCAALLSALAMVSDRASLVLTLQPGK